LPEHAAGLDGDRQLAPGDLGRGHRVVREGGKAAVRVEEHALRSEQAHRPFRAGQHLVERLDPRDLLVHHPDADALVPGDLGEQPHLPGPRRGELEEQGTDRRSGEQPQERPVVAPEGHGLVRGPVAPADVEREPTRRQSGGDPSQQSLGERQLLGHVAAGSERAAHEAAIPGHGAPEHHLGKDRLVELDERGASRQQEVQLLAKDPDHVVRQRFPVGVSRVGDALHPHGAGQEIGAGERDLHGKRRALAEELELVDGDGTAPGEGAEDRRVAHLARRDVECPEFPLELVRVLHVRKQVGDGHELAVVETGRDEARVVVPALLSVRHHVDPGHELGVERQLGRVVRRGLELRLWQPSIQVFVKGLEHPARPGPAADPHDRQGGDGRHGCRRRERLRDPDREDRARGHPGASPLRIRRDARRRDELPLGDEEAVPPAPVVFRDQLVPRHPAPGRKVLADRGLGRGDLEQLPREEGVDVLADEEQQPAAAVEIAAVEPDGGVECSGILGGHGGRP